MQKNLNIFFRFGKAFWNMKERGIIIPTIVYAILVQIVNPVFFTIGNINNLLRQTGFVFISGIGMTLVLIAAGIDLSVGSVLALACVSVGIFMVHMEMPLVLAILLAILIGAVVGMINGTIIVKFKTPPMIMTLGMMFMARGMVYVTTKGLPIYPMPRNFQALEQSSILGVPSIVWLCVFLCIFFHIILTRTSFGRSIYAVGGNIATAKLSGIPVGRVTVSVFIISGIMAAITGIMMGSRLGSAQPSVGTGQEMIVIAACIVGGTSTFGGRGTILGTAIGAFFMNMLTNSMTLMRVDIYYQNLVVGAVLVVAVILDQYARESAMRGAKKTGRPAAAKIPSAGQGTPNV
jgi:ribose transport system permease protein